MFFKRILCVQIFFLLLISQTKSFLLQEEKSTASPLTTVQKQSRQRLDVGDSMNKDKMLSPEAQSVDSDDANGFIEVKESDIPEGAMVYVLEEPVDDSVDGETLKTASNIVFRPLFRYRGKQEAQRRNSNRIRRRYFIPRRSYRQTYSYPYSYYYPQRYY